MPCWESCSSVNSIQLLERSAGSPVTPIHSQETSQDDVNGIMPESGSLPHAKPSIKQINQDKRGKLEKEEDSSHNKAATMFINEKKYW